MTTDTETEVFTYELPGPVWKPGLGRMAVKAGPQADLGKPFFFDLAGLLIWKYGGVDAKTIELRIDPWGETDEDNLLTGETVSVLGFEDPTYLDPQLDALARFLRDVRTNIEIMDIQDEIAPGRCDFEQFLNNVNHLIAERGHSNVRFVAA